MSNFARKIISMETFILPSRFENINKVDSLSKDWDLVKLAIRPDCRDE